MNSKFKMHNSKLTTLRFFLGVAIALVICFGLQAVCYYGFDLKARKCESNYFSTLGRFQAASHPAAEIAFAGSSITGRLPGREVGNDRIANLGSDGGPALDGIRLINMGRIETPKWLVVEANTLFGSMGADDNLIIRGAQGRWFTIGARIPILGAMARPSGALYTLLLQRPTISRETPWEVNTTDANFPDLNEKFMLSLNEKDRILSYVDELKRIHQRGCEIIIVNYPAGVKKEREDWLMKSAIVEFSDVIPFYYIDLEKQIPREEIQFTDSVHLAPSSAAKILSTVEQVIKNST
jgi:hypothetical protein